MSDSHVIPLQEARIMTKAYRDNPANRILANTYEAAAFQRILSQPGCVSIRCYFAYTTEQTDPGDAGRLTLVMVGVDSNGKDMADKELAERGLPCPIMCDNESPLNIG